MSDTENMVSASGDKVNDHVEKDVDTVVSKPPSTEKVVAKTEKPEKKIEKTEKPEKKIDKAEKKEKAEKIEKPVEKNGETKTAVEERGASAGKKEVKTSVKKIPVSDNVDSPAKKKKKEEQVEHPKAKKEESEESEESDEEEEQKVGLLELPAVIEGGRKRERKKVERMEFSSVTTPKDRPVEIPEGSGDKLGDIPRIELKLGKYLAEDLKPVHRVLYSRVGSANEVKRNIRKFCGFTFVESDPEYEKKVVQLNKMTISLLKIICDVFDLERTGHKEDIVKRLMDFMMKPVDSGKPLPKPKPKRKRSSSSKPQKGKSKKPDSKDGEKKKSSSPKKKPATSKEDHSSGDDHDDDGGDDDDDDAGSEKVEDDEKHDSSSDKDEVSDDNSDEDSEVEPPKKKKAKTVAPKKTPAKKAPAPKTPVKKPTPKKAADKKKKAVDSDSDGTSSDDEPLVPAKKKPPTDDELRDVIKKILDTANLEEVTMKTVCKEVYAKYPDFNLLPRKDFIKATVKQIIR